MSNYAGWVVGVVRSAIACLIALACVLVSTVFTPLSEFPAAQAALPPPPGGPAAVVPTREVVSVPAPGPTIVSASLTKDAVWGPQGSPYVIQGTVNVPSNRALTLLPGTVVKFADTNARLFVNGQLLSLGTAAQPVHVTSIKDDSVGGDTNGDGSASSPARGDWWGISIYSKPAGPSDEESSPVSVFDYTKFAYGGYHSAVNCASGAMVEVAVPTGRAIITNSEFRESYRSGVASGAWEALQGTDHRGMVAVYGNRFTNSKCGVSMAEGDIAGNFFGSSLETALFSNFSGNVQFRHNITNAPVISSGGNGVRFRFNNLNAIGSYGAPNQQTGDYRWNFWSGGTPLKSDPLTTAPPEYLPPSIIRAYHPTYGPVDTGIGALNYAVEDLTVNDAGKSLVASRTYSSNPQGSASDLGTGWRSSFSEALAQDSTGALTMEAADGGQVPFGSLTGTGNASGQSDTLGVAADITTGSSGSTVTDSANTSYNFDTSGQLTSMVLDDPGHEVDIDRTAGKVTKATGVSGRYLEFSRSSGKLASTQDSQGRQVAYAYSNDLLSSATGVDNKTETYTYGAGDRLTKVTAPSGLVKMQVGYDSQGRVEWVEQAGEGRATIAYQTDKRTITRADGVQVVQLLDSYGRLAVERVGNIATHVIYDADGREVMRIDGVPAGAMNGYSPSAPTMIFNDRGDPIWQIDEVGRGIRTFFNPKHKPTKVRDLRGGITTYAYGAQGRVTSVVDPRNATWQVEHNGRGQVTKLTDPVGRDELRTYESDGDPATTTNYFGGQSTFTTNALGRITSRTDPQGHVTAWTYTPWGAMASQALDGDTASTTFDDDRRPVTASDPRGETTTYAYDTSGRLDSTTSPAAGVTSYDYDVMGRVTDVTDPLNRVMTRIYNDQGLVTRITGAENSRTDTEYDPSGRAVWVTDALGAVTQTVVDRSGRALRTDYPDGGSETFVYGNGADITSYTNPLNGTFTYTYNKSGDLTQTKSPLNGIEQQTYDLLGRPLVTTDARNNATTLAYSNSGRTTTATDPLGAVSTIATDTSGRVVAETDGMGRDTTYTYDGAGRVLTRNEPGGRVSTTDYDEAGNPIAETDPAGRTITAMLDDLGRPDTKTYHDGSVESFEYDAVGNLTNHTDRRGHTWTYEFDGLNRVTTETDPLGGTVVHTWDKVGNETTQTDPTGIVITTAYDSMGRPAVTSNPAGAYVQTTYDKIGNPLTVRSPVGGVTTRAYDTTGRLTTETLPNSAGITTYTYDLNDNLLTSKRDNKTRTWVYDSRNRTTQQIDRRGNATISTYNLADQITSLTTPSGSATTYGYNSAGRLASTTNDTGNATSYTWTLDDQLASLTLPRGGGYDWTYDTAGYRASETVHTGGTGGSANPTISFTNDPLGNVTAIDFPSGRQIASTYDKLGRLKTETATVGTTLNTTRAYGYDGAGRLTSATRTNAPSLGYTYDTLGRMATSTDQIGTTTFGYDDADRLTSITPPSGQTASTFGYDGADRPTTMRGAANLNYSFSTAGTLTMRSDAPGSSGAQVNFAYDADNRPTTITSGNAKITATYNTDGNLATQTQTLDGLVNDEEGTTTYTYDDNNRLASATISRNGVEVRKRGYTWDGDNNRSQSTLRNGDPTAPTTQIDSTYDKAGRLLSTTGTAGTTSYTYDLDGQLTNLDAPGTSSDTTYTYDGFGELATTTVGSGGNSATTSITRDGLSRIAGWNSGGTATSMGYTGKSDALTSHTTNTQTTQLVRDMTGELLSARSGTQIAHAATNTHGDLIAWRATGTALITSTLYDPFGQPTKVNGTGTGPGASLPIGYESHLTLPGTGLSDLGSRSYDPATGRFTSQDVVIGNLASPVSLNRYTYAYGDPMNYTDPTGYCVICWENVENAASAISNGYHAVVDTGGDVLESVVEHGQAALQTIASTSVSAVSAVSALGSTVASGASKATRALQSGVSWVKEHQATVAAIGAGIVVGGLCTAVTGGVGALGCAAGSGFVAGLVGNYFDPNADHSFKGYLQAGGTDAAFGLVGLGAGKLLAPVAKNWVAPLRARSQSLMSRGGQGISNIRSAISRRIPGFNRARVGAANTATMSGGSGRAAVLHHPRGSVQIGRDPDTVAFAMRADVPDGHLAVAVHGTPSGFAPGATLDDVIGAVRKHPDYVPGMPICLYSCHAGANGTAEQLAAGLGSPITAPTSSVHLDFDSTIPYLDPGGAWRKFS